MFRRVKKGKSRQHTKRYLITKLNPRSPISEQYRTIRTNLQFTSVDTAIKTMLVTSTGPAEGKSMTAANLAVVYAQLDKKVLLIDADLRKPTVHYTFSLDNFHGLSNLLVSEMKLEDIVNDSNVENLEVITSGPIPPNPSELLGSNKMETLIKEAAINYDIIIFDTPPLLAVTDAQILSNEVDGTLLVIRSGKTEQDEARKAMEALKLAKAKLLGAILNDKNISKSNYYYYYGK